ncbi:hypothetical protein ACHHYP_05630 [Achlya hypogyna]|uniref:Thioredoxin domain-containing protein n=1 Tax=Achlya hypogyna TaxID=1202772 RepID=A0A1V9YX38_ACHHY|nr:hypothetical protein ACHHYP_05630 [Achlya hypogyna]
MKPPSVIAALQIFLVVMLVASLSLVGRFATALTRMSRVTTALHVEKAHLRGRVFAGSTDGALQVNGFDAAEAFLNTVDIDDGPFFVHVTSARNVSEPEWCELCGLAKDKVAIAFETAPPTARLLHVLVSEEGWESRRYSLRSDSQLNVDELPAILRYDGSMHTSLLLSEGFVSDPVLLRAVFQTSPAPRRRVLDITTVQALERAIEAASIQPLFTYFVSGRNPQDGRLWCRYCDRSDIPIVTYYNEYAPVNATLLRVIVADSYADWQNPTNPFARQQVVPVSGLPMLARLDATATGIQVHEYVQFFEERESLRAFFVGS